MEFEVEGLPLQFFFPNTLMWATLGANDAHKAKWPGRIKTMGSIIIPASDGNFNALGGQFSAAMTLYGTLLGFSPAEKTAVSASVTAFSTDWATSEEAKSTAKGAVSTKNKTREATTSAIREAAARILASPAATPAIIASFGMNPNPVVSGPVAVPLNLVGNATSNGNCELKWKRNGNASNTVFVLESKSATGNWTMFGTTTKTKFTDTNAAPGVQKLYRVRAERGGTVSAYSNEAVIYGTGGSGFLAVAA